jgi:hypothetical protein
MTAQARDIRIKRRPRAPSAGGGAVSSVFGRTGAVVAASGDYDATQLDMAASSRILGRTTAGAGLVEELTGAQAAAIVAAATTSAQGAVELATTAETQTGTDAVRAVTPAGLAATSIAKSIGVATGDLVTFSGASTPTRLGIGIEGQVLGVVGGLPAWVSAAVLAGGLILGDTVGVAEGLVLDSDLSLVLT